MSDRKSYVSTGDGSGPGSVSIKWPAVFLTVGSLLLTFGFAAVTTILETFVNLQVWAMATVGGAQAQYYQSYLTESASIWGAALDAASASLAQFGPLAPWVAALEIIVIVAIGVLVWGVAVG